MTNDQSAWLNNSKYQWVYNACELLNRQHKSWCPFPTDEYNHPLPIYTINNISNGYIWIPEPSAIYKDIQVELVKGSIKNELTNLPGQVLLLIHGFCMMNFKQYTGTISMIIHDHVITQIKLS